MSVANSPSMLPLSGVRVLDLTTLVPGPLATLALAEAGAHVLKIERPGGDEARTYEPKAGADSGTFALLNRGKRSLVLNLKTPDGLDRLRSLAEGADVLVEQFRPGVMDRLGLDFANMQALNPRLIYCSITGYGQSGPSRDVAAHDLNYIAETGMLSLVSSGDGTPGLPPALIADIGGGSYPAIINILMALLQREKTGKGCYIDVAMAENVFPFLYWALVQQQLTGAAPMPGGEMTTGGTARYRIYKTADGRFLTVAPVEDRFWDIFCEVIELEEEYRADQKDPAKTIGQVAARIKEKTANQWLERFEGHDACVAVVATIGEALQSQHFQNRGVFQKRVQASDRELVALPMPLSNAFRHDANILPYPRLDEAKGDGGWEMFAA
jgi:crotonobetainyl-CoA:carnitine CoA-transferase CaiB-like acyl-CoA transferase